MEKILLETPAEETDKVVIFLPGVSGGAFSERFAPLVKACLEKGLAIARLNLWNDGEELKTKSIAGLHEEIKNIIESLKQKGYRKFFGVGKSFGGGLILTYIESDLDGRVLWAPAVDEVASPSLLGIKVDRADLASISSPVLFIHGTADQSVPFSNSELLMKLLADAELFSINGADHSFRDKVYERELTVKTVDFISKI